MRFHVVLLLFLAASGAACDRAKKAGRLLDAVGCSDGDKAACDEHRRELDASCRDGEAQACTVLGIVHQAGRIVQKDLARAADLFEKGCTMGDGAGCWYLGSAVSRGEGRAKDAAAGRAFYEKGCTMGNVNACYDAGVVHEHGRGGPKSRAAARTRYERACTLSARADGLGCSRARELAAGR